MSEIRGRAGQRESCCDEDDCGAVDLLDQLRDGEGFPGAGDAEKDLMAVAVIISRTSWAMASGW